MPKSPIVSIIVPTYSSSSVLENCLQSIAKQSYGNIELIVVDNHSKDSTKEIAKNYTDKIYNKGPERSAQRNFGVKNSKGEYVLIIDSDMELTKDVVKACVEKIQTDNQIKGIVIPEESFGEGFWAQCKKLERSFYVGVDWMEAARFFNKKAYIQAGGYDESMISGEDWDLSHKIEAKGRVGRIGEIIRHNEGNLKLSATLRKKYYYAKHFGSYVRKQQNLTKSKNQTSIIKRYFLFFSSPAKLFKNPALGLGMLIMKSSEFSVGAFGYVYSKIAAKI